MSGASFQDLNSAARMTEAIKKIATDAVLAAYPRPRFAEVLEIDMTGRTVVVQYPDEEIPFRVPCGAYMPLAVGQVVRIFGPSGGRYVDEVIGAASFDGTIGDAAQTFVCANQAAMLACGAGRGDFAIRTDTNESYILTIAPATVLGNWQLFLDPGAEAVALNVLANHEAALNPHPVYMTEAEGDARYTSAGAIATAIGAHEIAADPHAQYVSIAGGDIILPGANSVVPLTIRGHATQVADLFDVLDGGGVTRIWVTAAGVLSGVGSGLTSLNASNISSGTLDAARLPSSVWTSANDGAASGLDADLLDGQHGAYYLAAGSYTAADVLAKLLTVDGAASTLDADLLDGQHGSYYLDWANVTGKPDPVVTVTLTGDVTGTAAATLTDLASGTATITTTIAADSVALGTDTTGNYVATVAGTTNQVSVAGSGGETAAVILSLPQDIHAAATPTFARLTLSQTTGTSPLSVSSTTVNTNFNADLLDGQHGSYFASQSLLESLMGDLMFVGLYSPTLRNITNKALTSNVVTLTTEADHGYIAGDHVMVTGIGAPFDGDFTVVSAPTTVTFTYAKTNANVGSAATTGSSYKLPVPVWSGSSSTFRHKMYWIVVDAGEVDFIDTDLSGRYEIGADSPVSLVNGDWVIATYASHNPATPNQDLVFADITFQMIPFSTETYVNARIATHALSVDDPHSAAGYLTRTTADPVYASTVHLHTSEILSAIADHEGESDPHPGYLTLTEGNAAYATLTHLHTGVYEPLGTVAVHVAATDPHPQYLVQAEGDALYALVSHDHDSRYALISQIPTVPKRIRSTDSGGQENNVWIGSVDPNTSFSASVMVGDLWIETFDIGLQAPSAPSNFTGSAPTGTVVNLSWDAYGAGVAQTQIQVDRENSVGSGTWTNLLDDITSVFDVTKADTGRSENTQYSYRARGRNATGWGPYSTLLITTGNDAPAAPTSQSASVLSDTSLRLTWTASGAPDLHVTQPYEVFLNGVLTATDTASPYDFTGLIENTLYTLGVRAKDTATLVSATVTATGTTANGTPTAPSGLATSAVDWQQGTMTWSAVTGISDLASYEVFKNGVSQGTTTNLTWTFTGLSASTSYTMGVRSVDTGALTSSTTTIAMNTTVNPDTTPPANATIVSFKPETTYGNMVLRFTTPADSDFDYYTVQRSLDGSNWTDDVSASSTPSQSIVRTLGGGAYTAGQTVYTRVKVRDTTGNWATGSSQSYTLITSPTYIAAASTNLWQEGSGWNPAGNYRPAQSYNTDSAYMNTGCWFYGTAPYDQLYYAGRRTMLDTSRIFLSRNTWGTSSYLSAYLNHHAHTSRPAIGVAPTVAGATALANQMRNQSAGGGDDDAWNDLPSGWAAALVDGTYRGFATYQSSGAGHAFCNFDSVGENGYSGLLELAHLG